MKTSCYRCVVGVKTQQKSPAVHRTFAASEPAPETRFNGPLIHLHLHDFHHGGKHNRKCFFSYSNPSQVVTLFGIYRDNPALKFIVSYKIILEFRVNSVYLSKS